MGRENDVEVAALAVRRLTQLRGWRLAAVAWLAWLLAPYPASPPKGRP
jgi:hypothetical protein